MINGILGKKIGMTQVFDDKGDVHPVTVLQAGPCVITQIKRNSKDGYEAAQIGLVEFVKGKNVSQGHAGTFRQARSAAGKVHARSCAGGRHAKRPQPKQQTAEGEAPASNGDGAEGRRQGAGGYFQR